MDFKLTSLNSDAYVKKLSISKTQSFGIIRLLPLLQHKKEPLNIKNIHFYLRNWGNSPSISQEGWGWEYNISPTELLFDKILLDNQIQYRSISGSRENHDRFRDAWGRISLDEWTDLKNRLLIEKNSQRHITILCEITFDREMEDQVCEMFSTEKPGNFDIRIKFNSTECIRRVKLQPASIGD